MQDRPQSDALLRIATNRLCDLCEPELVAVAFCAMRRMEPDHATKVAQATLPQGAGQPIAPLMSFMDQAAFWADMAAPAELDAYCFATFNRMHPQRQADFLSFALGRKAA